MPKAFVTGITGQTGSYLAENLAASGWEVHGLVRGGDDLLGALTARLPGVELIEGDLADTDRLAATVLDLEPDAIFNLGGLTSVAQSWKQPGLTAQVTGFSAAALLDAALQLRAARGSDVHFVQATSAEIFGSPAVSPQTESTPILPINPYGAAKAYAHFLVGSYRQLGLAASSCILYNHESPRRPETFVTRKITRAVARISLGLQDKLVLGSLDVRRDWGWAPDYARAIELMAEAPADDYIVATGESHSIGEFVAAAFACVGIDDWRPLVEQDEAFMRPQDATELSGDSSKIRSALGWAPSVTFDEIVAAMVLGDREQEMSAQPDEDAR